VQHDRERQVLMKTTSGRVEALAQRLAALHPYAVPELLVIPVAGGSDAYLSWVRGSTDSGAGPVQS
jgi:periplasmic divalent cation tolerance protein